MPPDKPDLLFGPGPNSGFTPAGIAAFDDLRPAAVVRELIQNALDAARLANVNPAVVRFRVNQRPRRSIPGLPSYSKAFERAVVYQQSFQKGGLASQAELVRKRISAALASENFDVLSVCDNGIGLNEQRMNALLSDGLSVKGNGSATGTYGNGHSTAIPASDLRYVLYGGVAKDGKRISAGHAVLASHYVEGEAHLRGGDGFFVRGFKAGAGTLYDYPSDGQVSELISKEIDRIENASGHGTTVIIPAFNRFLEKKQSLIQMVTHAASANFFVAIHEGELEIEVEDASVGGVPLSASLNGNSLRDVLKAYSNMKRSPGLISGQKAFEAYRTFLKGKRLQFQTSNGEIEIRLIENPAGVTRVDLCRNGMWITNDLPGFRGKFADRVPFHAVLSLKAGNGGRLHEFVRLAEGPLHDKLAAKRLDPPERGEFKEAIREIVEWLRQQTSAMNSDAFTSENFLTLDFGLDGSGGGRGARALRGDPVVINRRPAQQLHAHQADFDWDGEGPGTGGAGKRRNSSLKGPKSRPQLSALFRAVSLPAAERRRRIQIQFSRACADAQLRLLVDEGLDATCDRHGLDKYSPAALSHVKINGEAARDERLESWEGRIVGVKLGNVAQGQTLTVETDFQLGDEYSGLLQPSLRIEIFSTPKSETGSENSTSVEPEKAGSA